MLSRSLCPVVLLVLLYNWLRYDFLSDLSCIKGLLVVYKSILQNDMSIIVHVDVANVDDERTVNTLEHVRVQLWLNVTHRTRLSVTFAVNHVNNAIVLHCLNISNVSDGDSLASHTATNQEYIGRVQTLVWYFHFCFHNDFV